MLKKNILSFVFGFLLTCTVNADTQRFGEKNWEELTSILSNKKISPHWRDEHGHLAAYLHLNFGSELTALYYLERVKSKDTRRKYAEELLPSAVYRGSEFMTRALLKMGANPNLSSNEFYSPLMIAASDQKLEIMRILLNAGADPYFSGSGSDTLSIILRNGQNYAMNLLFDHGFRFEKYQGDRRNLPFFAVLGNSELLLKKLIENGFSVTGKSKEGDTLLTFAIKTNASDEILKMLILKGVDQCETDQNGLTPIQIIEEKNKTLQKWDWKYEGIILKRCAGNSVKRIP